VSANVTGVEEPPAAGLDEQGVGVEGAVVHKPRGYDEGPEAQRLAVTEMATERERLHPRHEERCLGQDRRGLLAEEDRHRRIDEIGKAVVIGMAV